VRLFYSLRPFSFRLFSFLPPSELSSAAKASFARQASIDPFFSLAPLLPRFASLPNELWRLPQALLVWQARSSVRGLWDGLWDRLAFEVDLAKERKGVVAGYRFAGELKSLLVDL
jgi:hypothetical protein